MSGAADVDFSLLDKQLVALLADEPDPLANTANFVALLYDAIPAINWLGVYVLRGDDLVLGPFQGKPACVRLPLGQGVCGTAASLLQTIRVADVHAFTGHIACDPASNAEIVVPLMLGGKLVGVLDIDSPQQSRFTARDQAGLETLCRTFTAELSKKAVPANGTAFI
ncbi:MAG TPA: GAF domain-containing protein [Woeseiaceae bacterium]|nr:GAF domain-containing protein [Woeseiaceae bacterium]